MSLFNRGSSTKLQEITIGNPLWFGYKLNDESPIYSEFSKLYRQVQLIKTKNIPIKLPESIINACDESNTYDTPRIDAYINMINAANTDAFRYFCKQYNENYRYTSEDPIDFLDNKFIKFFIIMVEAGKSPHDILEIRSHDDMYNTPPFIDEKNETVMQYIFLNSQKIRHQDLFLFKNQPLFFCSF